MGLDMYAYSVKREALKNPDALVDLERADGVDPETTRHSLMTWRKFNHLHGWMQRLYYERGGQGEDFNCNTVALTSADLASLEAQLDKLERGERSELTATSGFFFGGPDVYPEDIADTREFIARARDAIAQGEVVFYDSWW